MENVRKKFIHLLKVKAFRNHLHTSLELDPHFNLLTGHNGEGKTSLLEAIFFLSYLKPLRGNPEIEFINYELNSSSLSAQEGDSLDLVEIKLRREGKKELLINNHKPKRMLEAFGRLPCIALCTQDLEILYGNPSSRRNFIDLFLSQYSSVYLEHYTIYKKYLLQRNALLKQWHETSIDFTLLETLEEKLTEHGYKISIERKKFLSDLAVPIQEIYTLLGGKETLRIEYISKYSEALETLENYRSMLVLKREKDKILSTTTLGPHRDDLDIKINSLLARYSSSQGQQRTALLALKFACYRLFKDQLKISPILILDDMFSDLDQQHREHLTEFLQSLTAQVIFTCTEPELAGKKIQSVSKIFYIEQGTITQ